jgi:hypothetical protein
MLKIAARSAEDKWKNGEMETSDWPSQYQFSSDHMMPTNDAYALYKKNYFNSTLYNGTLSGPRELLHGMSSSTGGICDKCKDCGKLFARRSELLKHYKLDNRHYGRGHKYSCTYSNFTFKNTLRSHLSRNHPALRYSVTKVLSMFTCHIFLQKGNLLLANTWKSMRLPIQNQHLREFQNP